MVAANIVNLADKAISTVIEAAIEEIADNVRSICQLNPTAQKACQTTSSFVTDLAEESLEIGSKVVEKTKTIVKDLPLVPVLSEKVSEFWQNFNFDGFGSNTALTNTLKQNFTISEKDAEKFANQAISALPALLPIGKLKALKNAKISQISKPTSKAISGVLETNIKPVKIYTNAKGNSPYSSWLKKLPVKEQALINEKIDLFKNHGGGNIKFISSRHDKIYTRNIFEIKINGDTAYRIYFGSHKNQNILLYAGLKQNQDRDLKLAFEYWKDYLRNLKD